MEILVSNALLSMFITCSSYMIGLKTFRKFKRPWLNPLYTVTVAVVCLLSVFHIDHDQYQSGADIFSLLLGTATVSLAVPLYKQLSSLKKHFHVILSCVSLGNLMGIGAVIFLAKGMHLQHELLVSLVPKSVTLPIATSVSGTLGGIPSLTVVFVVVSALFSIMTGPTMFKLARIKSEIAKGLALGTSAQALGVGRALEIGELEGAMGSIAMSTSALFMSLIGPLLVLNFL